MKLFQLAFHPFWNFMNIVVNNNDFEPGILVIHPCEGRLGTTMPTKHLTFVVSTCCKLSFCRHFLFFQLCPWQLSLINMLLLEKSFSVSTGKCYGQEKTQLALHDPSQRIKGSKMQNMLHFCCRHTNTSFL